MKYFVLFALLAVSASAMVRRDAPVANIQKSFEDIISQISGMIPAIKDNEKLNKAISDTTTTLTTSFNAAKDDINKRIETAGPQVKAQLEELQKAIGTSVNQISAGIADGNSQKKLEEIQKSIQDVLSKTKADLDPTIKKLGESLTEASTTWAATISDAVGKVATEAKKIAGN